MDAVSKPTAAAVDDVWEEQPILAASTVTNGSVSQDAADACPAPAGEANLNQAGLDSIGRYEAPAHASDGSDLENVSDDGPDTGSIDSALAQMSLLNMGYEKLQVDAALLRSGGDVNGALDMLMLESAVESRDWVNSLD
jgi:hypothetical protein